MKLIIDIPEQIYLNAKADLLCGGDILVKAIKNGTPLPKVKADVLDKIRAEITNIPITDTDGHNNNWYREPQAIINDVLQIIDKYRGEEI